MANIMTQYGSQDNVLTYEHYCDHFSDRANIDSKYITLGSKCIVIEDETNNNELTIYIAKSDKTWVPV